MDTDEIAQFDALEQKIKGIDETIQREERARNMEIKRS